MSLSRVRPRQEKDKDMKTTETWAKAINQRIDNGFESFIAFAMQQADLTKEQAVAAFATFKKLKIVKIRWGKGGKR